MKRHTWTDKEINFLNKNYSKLGPDYCANKLGLRKSQIHAKVNKLNLKLHKDLRSKLRSKSPEKCNVNPNLFYELNTKEIVYLLGLIWADGFMYQSPSKHVSTLGFTMVKDDIKNINHIIESIGEWNWYERKQPIETWKSSINISTNNKRIFDFLIEHDYDKKSYISADKILSKIPDNLKHYWFRGLIDGDGCFYYYKPEKGSTLRQFALASTYEQDWSYFENLCNNLGIKYKIKRSKNKTSSSYIRITNKNGIKKLGDYLYKSFNEDNIGLIRKYKKYQLIINN